MHHISGSSGSVSDMHVSASFFPSLFLTLMSTFDLEILYNKVKDIIMPTYQNQW